MQIELGKLKAANVFASKEETRYYLNGVFFEIVNGEAALVATDGHRLIKIPVKASGEDQKVIIPRQLIDKIKPVRGVEMCDFLFSSSGAIEIEYDGNTYKGEAIDGTFPDYRRVIPDQKAEIAAEQRRRAKLKAAERSKKYAEDHDVFEVGFNPTLLADFAKINAFLGFKNSGVRMTLTHDAKAPVVITMGGTNRDQYLGVLMPMRV